MLFACNKRRSLYVGGWTLTAAAILMSGSPLLAQDTPTSAINDLTERDALRANIAGSPAERPIWLKFWPEFASFPNIPGLAGPPMPPGPPPPSPSTDPHDLNGLWQQPKTVTYFHTGDIGSVVSGARADGMLPYRPDAEKIFNYYLKSNSEGKPIAEAAEYCRPDGIPRALLFPIPELIVQRPDRIWQIFGQRQRVIYLNQTHPKNLKLSYMGHSVGYWEGNTLVIDTIGFNAKTTRLDRVGSPLGPKLHVVEHYTKSQDGSYIDVDLNVDDPEFYTQPFTVKLKMMWSPAANIFGAAGETHCEDDPQFIVKGVLYQGVPPSSEEGK